MLLQHFTYKLPFLTSQNDCSLQTFHPSPILVCWLGTKHCSQILMRCQDSHIFLFIGEQNFTSARFCSIMGWCPVPKTSEKQEHRLRAPRVFSSPLPTQQCWASTSSHLANLPHLPAQHIFPPSTSSQPAHLPHLPTQHIFPPSTSSTSSHPTHLPT